MKLHAIARKRTGALPLVVGACITPANITAFIDVTTDKSDRYFFGDKAFVSQPLSDDLAKISSAMITPCKLKRGSLQISA